MEAQSTDEPKHSKDGKIANQSESKHDPLAKYIQMVCNNCYFKLTFYLNIIIL